MFTLLSLKIEEVRSVNANGMVIYIIDMNDKSHQTVGHRLIQDNYSFLTAIVSPISSLIVLLQAAPNSDTPIAFSQISIPVHNKHFVEVKNSLLHSKVF